MSLFRRQKTVPSPAAARRSGEVAMLTAKAELLLDELSATVDEMAVLLRGLAAEQGGST